MLKRLRLVALLTAAGYILAMGAAPRPDYLELAKSSPAYVRFTR